jgi:hypothetical protein
MKNASPHRKAGDSWATTRTRTVDLLITNELLYQLSYGGTEETTNLWRPTGAVQRVFLV